MQLFRSYMERLPQLHFLHAALFRQVQCYHKWICLSWLATVISLQILTALFGFSGPSWASPLQQTGSTSSEVAQILLIPLGNTGVDLLTHTADLRLVQDNAGWAVDATLIFRIHNPNQEAVAQTLRLQRSTTPDLLTSLSPQLSREGIPLELQPSLEGPGEIALVTLAADQRLDLQLTYQARLPDDRLTQIAYVATGLKAWPTRPDSMRISFFLDPIVSEESWLTVAPDGWRRNGDELRWLFESQLPATDLRLRFVHPTTWARLKTAHQENDYGTLGLLYTQLYDNAMDDPEGSAFYEQALAAYQSGLTAPQAIGQPAVELADYHYGLARLYRSRILTSADPAGRGYLALMLDQLQTVLALPLATTSQVQEMTQWRVEGLTLAYRQAMRDRDWVGAAAGLEALAALPAGQVDPQYLAQERRSLAGQQALQLLRQGERDGAMALAGMDLADPALSPPLAAQSLFSGWQVTMTVSAQTIELELFATVNPNQTEALPPQIAHLEQVWRDQDLSFTAQQGRMGREDFLHLTLSFPAINQGPVLARSLLPDPNWSLLRLLLTQASATVTRETVGFWKEEQLTLAMDLRAAGDQWQAMAADLGRQAGSFTTPSTAAPSSADLDESIRKEVQRIYYQEAAQVWQDLANNSLVQVTLTTSAGAAGPTRTWLVTADSAGQKLSLQTRLLDPARQRLGVGILGITLLGLALALWRLL